MTQATQGRRWVFPGTDWLLGEHPRVMGILNVTPDSFSDGGQFADVAQAVRHGRELVDQGADILDIGGESTRPGAVRVGIEQETARVVPVISELVRQCSVPISIDTTKAAVAEAGEAVTMRRVTLGCGILLVQASYIN